MGTKKSKALTARELLSELLALSVADPKNSAWNKPIYYGDAGGMLIYGAELEDITDLCNGQCGVAECGYTLTDPDLIDKFDNGEDLTEYGYKTQGVHFAIALQDGH